MSQEKTKRFGAVIQRLIQREGLSRTECYEAFRQVLAGTQRELHQGAFLAALAAKHETVEEIAGAWQAIDELDTEHVQLNGIENIVDNSGTGMDRLKTFNVSSAAGIIAAAAGAKVARHGSRALTSGCGTVDILEAVGIDVECDLATVATSVIEAGIGLFNGMSAKVHPGALGRILSKIRFGSTLNIAASMANPARPQLALRGVYASSALESVAQVMRGIGYTRGLIVHGHDEDGEDAVDEVSILGETSFVEFKENGITDRGKFAPEDLGLRRHPYAEVAPLATRRQEARRFVEVLRGHGHQACVDFACLNAAGVLYVCDIAPSIATGLELVQQAVETGAAFDTLERWRRAQKELVAGIGADA